MAEPRFDSEEPSCPPGPSSRVVSGVSRPSTEPGAGTRRSWRTSQALG